MVKITTVAHDWVDVEHENRIYCASTHYDAHCEQEKHAEEIEKIKEMSWQSFKSKYNPEMG